MLRLQIKVPDLLSLKKYSQKVGPIDLLKYCKDNT